MNINVCRRRYGVTLIEIMVVIAIISIILGMSSALFTNFERRLSLKVAANRMAVVLRSAKNFAIQETSAAVVKISKEPPQAEIWGARMVGCWHLEDQVTTGAFGLHGKAVNTTLVPGKIGRGLHFRAGESDLVCGESGRLYLPYGFVFSFWIYPEKPRDARAQILWQVGTSYQLALTADTTLALTAFNQKLEVADYHLPLYQWTLLQLETDYRSIALRANNLLLKQCTYAYQRLDPKIVWRLAARFQGRLDEIRLLSWLPLEHYSLPEDIFFAKTPTQFFFDSHGLPDPQRNPTTVTIVLQRHGQQGQATVSCSPVGIIDITP